MSYFRGAKGDNHILTTMKLIQVLGPGCYKCAKLHQNVQDAVQAAGIPATVEKVTDIMAITGFGVMRTPALVIDGEVKSVGQLLSAEEIKKLLV
jgi:small redox-active disulfide protein 2